MKTLIDDLDGEAAALQTIANDPTKVVRAVGPLLDRLAADPRALALLDGLYIEGRALVASLIAEEQHIAERTKLIAAKIAPEPFDTETERKPGTSMWTLDSIKHVVENETEIRDALPAGDLHDPSKAKNLILALRERVAFATDDATRRTLGPEIDALAAEHEAFWHKNALAVIDSAGIAALRLPYVVRQMAPSAAIEMVAWAEERREIYAEPDVVLNVAHGRPVNGFLFGDDRHPSHVMHMAKLLSADMAKVLGEMRRRAHKGQSHLALLRRYKTLCEWYARDDVRKLSEIADASARPEDRLVEHLARFLFDQGLNPLSTPLTGRVRPDLIDLSQPRFTLYIEAKQHEDAAGAKVQARKGLRQIADTANILDPLGVKEAFLVVYRRRGEFVSFVPDALYIGRLHVHVLAIDVAPATEIGSREKHNPITFDPRTLIGADASHEDTE